ncbi:hypothetical protein EXIGLDRAFT_327816 [Exidia glandulosa HHB12029]|uniref:Uncharacterized protein n=1 Tax=Exidia glandulosa HHB12029 TaxID=1314781 RepID=A0A165LPB0_EXIGL|nr:hypothetical protein EXIGLDRAFT_327816 [Exidia glandulosa HHB12029]
MTRSVREGSMRGRDCDRLYQPSQACLHSASYQLSSTGIPRLRHSQTDRQIQRSPEMLSSRTIRGRRYTAHAASQSLVMIPLPRHFPTTGRSLSAPRMYVYGSFCSAWSIRDGDGTSKSQSMFELQNVVLSASCSAREFDFCGPRGGDAWILDCGRRPKVQRRECRSCSDG